MSKLKEADFYYGAILSHLFTNGICPMMIEGGSDRQVYEFTTNQEDFKLFAKYRSMPIVTLQDGYSSWQFSFSPSDISELKTYIGDAKHLSVGLVCGNEPLNKSEIAILHKEEISEILALGKESLTISRKEGERAFRISIGGGREQAMQIKCNRKY
ncbi:MAG: hypothetical protein LKJ90_04125 [Faecalibacterium sp.]|jgi:hypothetical protein|nr:hypothetical protein [Faecalibacterium sp.]